MSEAGVAAFQAGRWVEAIVAFRDAVQADPQDHWSRLNLARACFNLKDFVTCNRVLRDLVAAGPVAEIRFPALEMQAYVAPFDPAMDNAALLQLSRDWATVLRSRAGDLLPPPPAPAVRERLTIGFLCAYFGAPIDYLPVGLLDRAGFRVIGYGAARKPVPQLQSMPRFDLYRDLSGLDDRAAAERIRADGVDILVDLGGQGWGQRNGIALHRPAPVSVGWSNRLYPASGALIDWLLADWVTMPVGAERAEEVRVWRMSEPVLPCNHLQKPPPPGHPAADAPITFGTVASPFKLNGATLSLWAAAMRGVPGSRFLYAMETMSGDQAQHVARLFRDAGIGPDRVELRALEPNTLPLAINDVDVVLDTQPFTANFTTWQAAAQGVPMVSLRGTRYSGRMAAAVLTALGRVDWVAETPEQFVDIAVAMAGQARAAAGQRAARAERARTARMADPAHAARVLGRALQGIWTEEVARRADPADPGAAAA
ncbi:tetratricopeptide repeat protein [Marinibaculum pumilum]|uniref:Tetratricopeptide repeat protein n=1 Tax=Marinibaculum pumilum TaxID=1766165 RepID=A0ABV7L316_9PROT